MKKNLPEKINQTNPFVSKKFTPESLQDVLWDVLQKVKKKEIAPSEANSVTMAAKEICNVARLQIQFKMLEGIEKNSEQG